MTFEELDAATRGSVIRDELIERGMPAHVADGFVTNFRDESGLNPTINEAAPVVPGSRGGYGLAQWTGPRRVALERFAQSRGTNPGDMDTQLDFLMTELQGPESRAASAIYAAPDASSAATAVLNRFLRPAEEHRQRREARYSGGVAPIPSQGMPSQPDLPMNRLMQFQMAANALPKWQSVQLDPRDFMNGST